MTKSKRKSSRARNHYGSTRMKNECIIRNEDGEFKRVGYKTAMSASQFNAYRIFKSDSTKETEKESLVEKIINILYNIFIRNK